MKKVFPLFTTLVVLVLQVEATDPTRRWGKYSGGPATDFIRASITDNTGNIYVTGYTENTGLATAGASQLTFGGFRDAYLSKYDLNGILQWTTYIGGSGEDRGTSIAILPGSNNIVVTGYTNSTNNISNPSAHQSNYGGGSNDCFLICYSPSGTKLWATYFGSTGKDEPYAVVTNDFGDIFLTGVSASSTLMTTPNAFDVSYNGGDDGFLARFTENGLLVWSTYIGGSGSETMYAAVTSDSMVWVAGKTSSLELATPNVYQVSKSNGVDGILYAFNRNGSRSWSTYFGGNGEDIIWGIGYSNAFGTFMPSGRIYLSGQTTSTSGIATQGAHQTTYGGGTDALVATFSRFGALEWATYIGGSGLDMSYGMTFNSSTDLLVTGGTQSFNGISTPGAFQMTLGGSDDAFLMRFSPQGQRKWGTYYGGSGSDWGYNVSCNMEGDIILAGFTTSQNQVSFPQSNSLGGFDGLLVRFLECPETLLFEQPTDTVTIVGATVTFQVVPTVLVTYQWQVDNGTGFVNLSNAGPYSGVTTDILTVSNISPWMNNYKFRCLITNNTCTDTSDMANLSLGNLSVNKLTRLSVNIYPNPNQGNFVISDGSNLNFEMVTVYDVRGRIIQTFQNLENPTHLIMPILAPGIYIVESRTSSGIGTNRIIIND